MTSIIVTDALSAAINLSVTSRRTRASARCRIVFFGTGRRSSATCRACRGETHRGLLPDRARHGLRRAGAQDPRDAAARRPRRLAAPSSGSPTPDSPTCSPSSRRSTARSSPPSWSSGGAGLSAAEEHKVGIHGTSTSPLMLEGVEAGRTHLLGEVGRGHRSRQRAQHRALQAGRSRWAVRPRARSGRVRQGRRLGQPIASSGSSRQSWSAWPCAPTPSSAGLSPRGHDRRAPARRRRPAGRRGRPGRSRGVTIECRSPRSWQRGADWVVDEIIQLHGGNGYIEDYPRRRALPRRAHQPHLRRHQRDQPAVRPGELLRRAPMKDRLDLLLAPARRAREALLAPSADEAGDGPLAAQVAQVGRQPPGHAPRGGRSGPGVGTALRRAAGGARGRGRPGRPEVGDRQRRGACAPGRGRRQAAAVHEDLATLFVAERARPGRDHHRGHHTDRGRQ